VDTGLIGCILFILVFIAAGWPPAGFTAKQATRWCVPMRWRSRLA
jgi:hypothetical protein